MPGKVCIFSDKDWASCPWLLTANILPYHSLKQLLTEAGCKLQSLEALPGALFLLLR